VQRNQTVSDRRDVGSGLSSLLTMSIVVSGISAAADEPRSRDRTSADLRGSDGSDTSTRRHVVGAVTSATGQWRRRGRGVLTERRSQQLTVRR